MNRLFLRGKNNLIILASVMFFFLSACIKDKYDLNKLSDEIEINPGLTAPLVRGTLSLDDILKEISSETAGKDPRDSLLYVVYSDTFGSLNVGDIIDIPDQDISQFYIASDITSNPEWTGSSPGDTILYNKQKNIVFEVSHNEKIDSIKIKLCYLRIYVSSTFKHRGVLKISTDHIKTNGQSFSREILINDDSGTFDTTAYIILSNTTFYLDNSNPSQTVLPLSFDFQLINSGATVVAGNRCDISMRFENIQFSSVFGYLGEYDLFIDNGLFDLGIYDDSQGDAQILFADPRFVLLTDNSFGVPIEISLSDVSAYSEKSNVTTPVIFSGVNPFNITTPGINQIGQIVKDSIIINSDNCNIVQAMETSPKSFNYNISAKTNPEGPTGPYNFVTDNSRIDVYFEMVLPLWLMGSNIVLRDTVELDIEDGIGDFIDYINYFRITMEGTNGFPFEAALQVIFMDSSGNALDSLFTGNPILLNPALVGTNGKVTNGVDFKKMIEFSSQKLSGIKKTKQAIVKATLNTSNSGSGQYVKFFSYYKLDFKMSVKTNLTINSRQLND